MGPFGGRSRAALLAGSAYHDGTSRFSIGLWAAKEGRRTGSLQDRDSCCVPVSSRVPSRSFTLIFVRAASGRQRFNVLGAWNAMTRELIAMTNTTVVHTETMCGLLRKVAALGLAEPITLVLDNARYRRNAVVQGLATKLGVALLYLPSYSPNLNLIERLWKFIRSWKQGRS